MFRSILACLMCIAAFAGSGVSGALLGDAEARDIIGTVEIDSTQGTYTLRYNIVVSGFEPDSVKICGFEPVSGNLTFLRDQAVEDHARKGRIAYRFAGVEPLADKDHPFSSFCNVGAFGMNGADTIKVWRWFRIRPNTVTLLGNIIGWGLGSGELPGSDDRNALFYSVETGFTVHASKLDWLSHIRELTNFRDRWQFSLTEYQPLGLRFFPTGRSGFAPSLSALAQYSSVVLRRKSINSKSMEWGGQFEVRLDSPFERAYYSYATNHDGYHKVGLAFFKESGGHVRIGTRYELILIDKVTMFRVQMQAEGMGWDHGETETLMRENTRPWWHKGLALGSTLPFLPIVGLVKLIQALK